MYQYLLLILLLEWRLTGCTSSPTLEDNMLPTDAEVISDLINSYRRGQPEEEIALNLPTDEEAFNEIKPILQSGNPFYYINGGGHFISSSFPEIDARGFHESVFDDLDDFYPISQRGKKYDTSLAVSARGFYGDVFTDGFGNFHPVKRYYKEREGYSRQKRSYRQDDVPEKLPAPSQTVNFELPEPSQSKNLHSGVLYECSAPDCSSWDTVLLDKPLFIPNPNASSPTRQNRTETSSPRHKRSPNQQDWSSLSVANPKPEISDAEISQAADSLGNANQLRRLRKRSRQRSLRKRVPEVSKSGFHHDLFHDQFGKFDTLKRDPAEFDGDVFHKNFGKFETLRKRNDEDDTDWRSFSAPKRRPEHGNVNGDAFYSNFGTFETLKRAPSLAFDDDYLDDRLSFAQYLKRKPHTSVLNADAFHSNFGAFDPMKRTLAGDAFHSNFGTFDTMKRTLGGDAFHSNFGRFEPMKRTLAGDAFHSSFGRFEPMKRTLAGDAFHSSFGRFEPMKRTLAGDAFHSNFGSFDTMKRTLGGDAFHSQFGRFETMKRALHGSKEPGVKTYAFGAKSDEKVSGPSSRFRRFAPSPTSTSKSDELQDGSRSKKNVSAPYPTRTSTSSTRSN